ncbi:NEL-type E3 ubiquitin ligase domain-containing protein [Pseudomonas sp. UFMG81]|uniref:NEL-type E3 ubiquitin ligase domain-containing protein n=1 Tax=Pseudomonas sp. UFMG81 TaxID=2745936 RepID=UPI00188EAED9|nr:NEL-type E3 ubiquitin ligase domain-containing protein [Pseudomonas sp. UFMG81]
MATTPLHAKLSNAIDDFIAENLPDWLKRATPSQIATLRVCYAEHIASQQQVRDAIRPLKHPAAYAKDLLAPALQALLKQPVDLDKAQWRERSLKFDATLNRADFHNRYVPALQQFMLNFKQDQSFYPGTALVYPADAASAGVERELTRQVERLVSMCRDLDVGKRYQQHLDALFNDGFTDVLAVDRRRQLALATEIAATKEQLGANDLEMLRRASRGETVTHSESLSVNCGELAVMGGRVDGALAFELVGSWVHPGGGVTLTHNTVQGVILYLPDDHQQPLRRYAGWRAASLALGKQMREPAYRQAFNPRIGLADRGAYLATLGKRLADHATDMQASLSTISGELFSAVAKQHLKRIRDDARVLLVPNATVDAAATDAQFKALETAGLVLLNLAGLFVPGVGAVLLADMVRQTLVDVFEGVEDWSQGHQHEAVDHLLGVALTGVTVGATVAAGSFVRSAFVDELVPVSNPEGASRLWSGDLAAYADDAPPEDLVALDNGLSSNGDGHWWQDADGVSYRVVPSPGRSTWQLEHSSRAQAYAPILESNGERAWRLATERPLEWQGEHYLLTRLWPPARQLDAQRVGQILKVADIDQMQLRGLLVEGRPLPVVLRDTVERFAVDARIETFFQALREGSLSDAELLGWCVEQLDIFTLSEAEQGEVILEDAAQLREQMLEHFCRQYLAQDPQLSLVKRDFPGLPDAYALRLLQGATTEQRQLMVNQQRIPLALGEQARALLHQVRLVRAREALYLRGSYRAEAVELVFALLRRHADWPQSVNLVLREGSDSGRVLARLYPDGGAGQVTTNLVRRLGRFALYDDTGHALEVDVAEPGGLPEVLAALLPASHQVRLGWQGAAASERILDDLRGWLPEGGQALSRLLGLREGPAWHNPLRRQADGRLGYPLSGRGPGRPGERTLRDGVRALYPSFDEREVETFVRILMERPGTAIANLMRQQRAYAELDRALCTWVLAERAVDRQAVRLEVADEFRRGWRLQGERIDHGPNEPLGMRLSLVGMPARGLPELPVGADFGHITELLLVGLDLPQLPSNFLRSFPQLRWLNLSNNAMRLIPPDIARLSSLRGLQMARNRVRLDRAGVGVLRNLAQLHTLDLSANPLGSVSLEFRQLSRLREISLRRAGLHNVPAGLEWCGFLEYADLRDNQIASLPEALLTAPQALRQALHLSNNPLPLAVRERLYAPDAPPAVAGAAVAAPDALVAWLAPLPAAEHAPRQAQWQALRAEPGSNDLFELLGQLTESSDYRQARQDLGRRVWAMIDAAVQDARLCQDLFDLAAAPRTCVDSVASCFSTLEVRVFVAQALRERNPAQARTARLGLARRLFRLDQVERIALADIRDRQTAGVGVDEVEVSLAYRTGLAAELDLPGQPRTMQFQTIAGVTQANLNTAAAQVRAAEAGPGLAEYISQRDFWLEYLQGEYRARFQAVEQPYWDQLEELEDTAGLLEQDYLERMNQLARDREKARQALALRLTHEALAEPAPARH